MRTRRGRARLISEYVDARIGRHTPDDAPRTTPADADFDQLVDLARELSQVEIVPPRAMEDAVLQRLQREVARSGAAEQRHWWRGAWRKMTEAVAPADVPRRTQALRYAVLALATAGVASGLFWLRAVEAPLTAADLLARVDRLDTLAGPGEVFHRVVRASMTGPGPDGPVDVSGTLDEWFDGRGGRGAARSYASDGRLEWIQVSLPEGPGVRSTTYFLPNPSLHPQGRLVVRPTEQEYADALTQLPEDARAAVASFLSRRRLGWEPVWGDRWENGVVLGFSTQARFPGETVDATPWTPPGGGRGYELRVVDASRPWFEWRGDRIVSEPARFERVRYVAGASYLTLRETIEFRLDSGPVYRLARETVRTSREPLDERAEALFRIDAPAGTPVQSSSALEELRAVAAAMTALPSRVRTEH